MTKEEAIERVKARSDKWALDEEDLAALQALGLVTKVSEDERVRLEIHAYLFNTLHNTQTLTPRTNELERWLAYLEKQKEQNLEDIEDKAVRKYMKLDKFALANMLAERDKTNAEVIEAFESIEQKPAEWSEEDKHRLEQAINALGKNGYFVLMDWLKLFPERFNIQPKQEWSEEDEAAFGDLMWCIEQARKSAKDENDMGNIWFAENWVKNRLKSLHLQPKQEWNEEVEKDIQEASDYLRDYANRCVYGGNSKLYVQSLADRIESLRPQHHWKPSEEQIEAMEEVRTIFHHHHLWDEITPILYDYEELMRDLYKLM